MDLFKYYVNGWYRNRLSLKNIFYCQIHITKRCQNNCAHCYFRELNTSEVDIPIDQLQELLIAIKTRATDLGLLPRVDFTGGDPLLYPYLDAAVDQCVRLGIPYGLKCNPETIVQDAASIKQYLIGSAGVSLSLDGLREKHDHYRREGSFDCTIDAINVVKELGVQLRINTTVSRVNIHDLIPLIDFLLAEHIVVDDYTWSRYWSLSNPDEIISATELEQIFNELTQYMRRLFSQNDFYYQTYDNRVVPRILFGFKEHQWYPFFVKNNIICPEICKLVSSTSNCINCTATKHFYIIDPDMAIYKCRKLPETKIKAEQFGTPSACQYNKEQSLECLGCKYYNGCGGCSAITKCFTGKIHLIEPLCPYYTK